MKLFHHPLSLNSQKIKLVLEEKGLQYEESIVNHMKARNLDADFFRLNPNGSIPILVHDDEVVSETLPIIQYINSISPPLGGERVDQEKAQEWIQKIESWDPKLFTMNHLPDGTLRFFSKFKRRVVIARMEQNPDLAPKYHMKLQSMHAMEEKLKDDDAISVNKNQLLALLDDAEVQLSSTNFMVGDVFTVADCVFIPVLARIEFLKLDKQFFHKRPRVMEYWARMKKRPSYNEVIGQHVGSLRRMVILFPSVCNMSIRRIFKAY